MEGQKFFITRSDPMDPTSALDFYPPKGSDELHEALKHSYPHLKNLQARMRQAVIEFYLTEHQEQTFLDEFSSPTISDQPTPEYVSFNNMTPFTAPLSFPTTPAISEQTSPEHMSYSMASLPTDMPSLFPQTSNSPQISSESSSNSRSPAAMPTQDELTTVWALSSKPGAKIHKRRCMTPAEKAAYKQKRLEGACASCKQRRRKCKHNTTTSSSTPSSLPSSASSRPSKQRSHASKPPEFCQPPINHASNFNTSEPQYTSVNTDFSILGDFMADIDITPWNSNSDLLEEEMLVDAFKPYELPIATDPMVPFANVYDYNYDYNHDILDFTREGELTLAVPDNDQLLLNIAPAMSRASSSTDSSESFVVSPTDLGTSSSSLTNSPSPSSRVLRRPREPGSSATPSLAMPNSPSGMAAIPGTSMGVQAVVKGSSSGTNVPVPGSSVGLNMVFSGFSTSLSISIPGSNMENALAGTSMSHSCSSSPAKSNVPGTSAVSSSSSTQSAVLSSNTATTSVAAASNSACSTCWLLVRSACNSLGRMLFGSVILAAAMFFMSSTLLSTLVSFLLLACLQEILSPKQSLGSLIQPMTRGLSASLSLTDGTNDRNTLSSILLSLKRSVSSQKGFRSLSSDIPPPRIARRLAIGRRITALSICA